MPDHTIVAHDEWLRARKELLAREKEFTRLRDELSRERRELPWEPVESEYVFEGANGSESLAELVDGRDQLVVYHFMFEPDWDEGCPHCSFWADNFDSNVVHLRARDVTLVAVSRAPYPKLAAYRERMGWGFQWVSSFGNHFNADLGVSFAPEDQDSPVYNYGTIRPGMAEREEELSEVVEQRSGVSPVARRALGAHSERRVVVPRPHASGARARRADG